MANIRYMRRHNKKLTSKTTLWNFFKLFLNFNNIDIKSSTLGFVRRRKPVDSCQAPFSEHSWRYENGEVCDLHHVKLPLCLNLDDKIKT